MAEKSADEDRSAGFASRSDPPWLVRRALSLMVRRIASPARAASRRAKADRKRRQAGEPLRVDYFHQVDDPYSQLAAQALAPLVGRYDIEIVPHLAGPPSAANAPEAALLAAYARKDAADVAPHYCLEFPRDAEAPTADAIALAQRLLADCDASTFVERAPSVGRALWSGKEALASLASTLPAADPARVEQRVAEGTALRAKQGHYSGGMFHYAGEWYWGVDRLHHLERHLTELGLARESSAPMAFPRPDLADARGAGAITLEIYPSLRSPYTAIAFDRTRAFAERSGVNLVLRPVLPMVMRGVPATLAKGRYIFSDTWREADFEGVPYGNFVDPIGRPVERAYSLYPWARSQGREAELLSSFLRLAFAEGVDTSRDAGLRRVVETAGLSWDDAQPHLGSEEWRDELETNRLEMYDAMGLWGVPAYRVKGPDGRADFSCWGQDRLWLVAAEIAQRVG